MRNIDTKVEEKITLSTTIRKKSLPDTKSTINSLLNETTLAENRQALDMVKIRLRCSKTLMSDLSPEQDEYNYTKSINTRLKLTCTNDYYKSEASHEHFVRDPKIYFKTIWINWYNFIGFDTSVFIPSKVEWVDTCKKYNVKSLNDYYALCNEMTHLPKNPEDFYKEFTNIISELDDSDIIMID